MDLTRATFPTTSRFVALEFSARVNTNGRPVWNDGVGLRASDPEGIYPQSLHDLIVPAGIHDTQTSSPLSSPNFVQLSTVLVGGFFSQSESTLEWVKNQYVGTGNPRVDRVLFAHVDLH
jgi:hypothetical protein